MAGTALASAAPSYSRILGASDRVRVAICGVRGRGHDHIRGFSRVPNAEIAALCDVDENVLNQRLANGHLHRHSQSLALADGDLGVPGRERRLCGKAVLAQLV